MIQKHVSGFIIALCLASPLCAHDTEPPPTIPVAEWLKGPDRQDIAWNVQIFQSLTPQQRHLVQVLATIRGRDYLESASSRDLHFVTKIADEQGNWLDGQSYDHFKQPANFSGGDSVHSFANLYLSAGNYTIALIAYDSLHNQGNVWRAKLTVSAIVDVLPDLGRDFPVAEFLPPAKAALELKSADWEQYPPINLQNLMLDPLTLGSGVAHLPVANKKPVRIDVIVNLSDSLQAMVDHLNCENTDDRWAGWNMCDHLEFSEKDSRAYKFDEGLMLQVGNIISQIAPEAGCARFSAVDALRQDLLADRIDASQVDWAGLSKRIASTQIKELDVSFDRVSDRVLWFKQFVETINRDNYECGLPTGATNRALIVVSMPLPFPVYTRIDTVKSHSPRPACYHLRWGRPGPRVSNPYKDQTEQILSPLKPHELSFPDPEQLRRQIDFIVKDLAAAN